MSESNNIFEPLVDCMVNVGRDVFDLTWKLGCKLVNYKSKEQIEWEQEQEELRIEKREKEYQAKKEQEIEQRNKITINNVELDFNNLFFNCGLKNKLKDMPVLEDVKHHSTVDIYSFKLPVGVTVSAVREKIENLADFFEVNVMNIKLQKKRGLMDIIITKENLFKKTFKFTPLPTGDRLRIPVGHFINQDYLEKLLTIDMSKDNIPHAFVASTTGGGKSNFINVAILNWIMTKPPEDIQLFILDGKGGTDYAQFMEAPHIYKNTCFGDPEEVIAVLEKIVNDMNIRNNIFRKNKVKNFTEYNAKIKNMAHYMIIFDEYATYSKDSKQYAKMQSYVKDICSMGRSAGIHIMVATQDGRQAILDSMVKYNMPLKIGFKCDNPQHSKNICGFEGLETINEIGVGRIYGLPLDTEYIQFKTMLAPDSDEIRKMIAEKYPKDENKKRDSIIDFEIKKRQREEDDETELIGYGDGDNLIFLGEECED